MKTLHTILIKKTDLVVLVVVVVVIVVIVVVVVSVARVESDYVTTAGITEKYSYYSL